MNDLPGWIKTNTKIFADDTRLWNIIQHDSVSQELQEDLDRPREHNNNWILDFNIEMQRGMTNYHIGPHWTTSSHIGLREVK